MYDLVIIGGGPSGVAGAAYGMHMGLETLVIGPDLGGKVNYPFSLRGIHYSETVYGAELVRTFAAKVLPDRHAAENVESVEQIEGGFRIVLANGEEREGRTLLLAMGAKPRRLYVPGEQEYWGRGLSYSAVSHAPFFAGRDVAVIGNDQRAQVAVLELARHAHQVAFIVPRPQELDGTLLHRIHARPNVALFRGWEVIAVEGTEFLTGLSLQSSDGVIRELALDGVFVEIGLIPNSDLVAHLVERDERGHIKVDHQARTSHPAIFAAGDITNVYGEQVPIALGDGIKAALSASEYLAGQA